MQNKVFLLLLILVIWMTTLMGLNSAEAGPLADRISAFPNWQTKPPVQSARGDLLYPDWMAGTWEVTSTLVDLIAPLAPAIVTPGFAGNRQYLHQPFHFQVRFRLISPAIKLPFANYSLALNSTESSAHQVISDRAFNGLNLAKAYLGDQIVQSVKVAADTPNRQITVLKNGKQLVSTVTGRAVETVTSNNFVTTEVFQQIFRGTSQPYINEVETTTSYQRSQTSHSESDPEIIADQVTAIYLSPQDPDYFKAGDRPVALYRYRLEFSPTKN